MDHELGFGVWDIDARDTKPLRRKMGGKKSNPDAVLRVFLYRDSRQGQLAVASFHPDVFGGVGAAPWHAAIDYTIEVFEGAFLAARSSMGLPSRLVVDASEISARRIGTQRSNLVISADESVPIAVIYSAGLELPAVSAVDWWQWQAIPDGSRPMPQAVTELS